MTSEVVVMNRAGVALAADSAVTVEMGASQKVRHSALKLFTLSKYRPVGVMVYNNASLLGVPMETIIKLFRRHLGKKAYGTLREYGEALIRYLDGNDALFPDDVQDHYFLHAVETEYLRIWEEVSNEFVERGVYGDGDGQADVAKDVIARRLEFWRGQQDADYFEVRARDVVGRISGGVNDVVLRVFRGGAVGDEGVTMLREIANHIVEKDHFPLDVFSGLVIAGFGEGEHFPVVQHIEIGGVYGGSLKVRPPAVDAVTEARPSDVMAFAYKDMVERFLVGISGSFVGYLEDATTFIREMPLRALEAVPELDGEEKERAAEAVRRMAADRAAEFKQTVRRGFEQRWKKIVDAVEALTISELAQVASTLVDLSSFEQQMSLDNETVGGPVDVAVISKGDGFIWIDRKHYFRKELNDHFLRNYYDDEDQAGDDWAEGGEEDVTDDE